MTRSTDRLTAPSQNIFVKTVIQPDGTTRLVISSEASIGSQSIRVNATWQAERWEGRDEYIPGQYRLNYVSGQCSNSGALFLLMTLCSHGNILYHNKSTDLHKVHFLCVNVLMNILGHVLPVSEHQQLALLGNYAVAVRRPPSIFQRVSLDPHFVVDATIRGLQDVVLNILRADPSYLLKPAEVENAVGVKSIRTPLQAAILGTDILMMENMWEHFERLPDGPAKMYEQILEIYKESLQIYYDKQQTEVERLTLLQANGTLVGSEALALAETRAADYLRALRNNESPNYLTEIVAAHEQAQAENAFDFQPYVEAICSAPDRELDEVAGFIIYADTPQQIQAAIARGISSVEIGFIKNGRTYTREEVQALPFSELTLLQKLNRFREKLLEHRQQEIISNSYHIIKSGEQNDRLWAGGEANRVYNRSYKQRSVVFSQVVGWAQVTADEAVRQDFRKGASYFATNPEPHCRFLNANNRGVFFVGRWPTGGWGYKFAVELKRDFTSVPPGLSSRRFYLAKDFLTTYIDIYVEKTRGIQNLLRSLCERLYDHSPSASGVTPHLLHCK